MSDKTPAKAAPQEKKVELDKYGRTAARPTDQEKLRYWFLSVDADCPDDLVVNAGSQSIMLGAKGDPKVSADPERIDVGDRRQGPYYVKLITMGAGRGLVRVRDLSLERVRQLEKDRKIRTGELPQPWIEAARRRAAQGQTDEISEPAGSKVEALNRLQQAALGIRVD